MSLTKSYKLDERKEIEGIEIKMPANDDGTVPTFVIARSGGRTNKRYQKAIERATRPVQTQIRTKTLDNAVADGLFMTAFIEGSMVTWKDVLMSDVTGEATEDPNQKAEFNATNATMLFSRLPELYTDLQTQANDIALFREDVLEGASKN